jgi:hypothetical protein
LEDERLLLELRNASLWNAMENHVVGLHNTSSSISIRKNMATQQQEETQLNVTLKPTLHE